MKKTKRGRTERFVLNEKFIFGAPRCMRCGKTLRKGEIAVCDECKRKRRGIFG